MRHSFFFSTFEEANEAESQVLNIVGEEITEIYQSNDGETGAIEVRFFTDKKLDHYTIGTLISNTRPDVYALNCEDY